jgi:hypothetical protein
VKTPGLAVDAEEQLDVTGAGHRRGVEEGVRHVVVHLEGVVGAWVRDLHPDRGLIGAVR